MAKSKTFEVFGKLRWAKVFPTNRDMDGPEGTDYREHDGMYSLDIIMDKENAAIFKASGSSLKLRSNDEKSLVDMADNERCVRFKRKHESHIPAFGGPPMVVTAEGTPIDPEEGVGIGNDSEGYVQFTVYQTKLHPGTRLEGVQVTDWIQYPLATQGATFKKRGTTTVTEAEVEGDEPTPAAKKASKAKAQVEELDDEIPL